MTNKYYKKDFIWIPLWAKDKDNDYTKWRSEFLVTVDFDTTKSDEITKEVVENAIQEYIKKRNKLQLDTLVVEDDFE